MTGAERARPWLAVTMGDPAGIGPEVVARAVTDPQVLAQARPLVVGDASVMMEALRLVGSRAQVVRVTGPEGVEPTPDRVPVRDLDNVDWREVPRGRVSAAAGRASYAYVVEAVRMAQAGQVAGVVTAPINKAAWGEAGYRAPGHTELLGRLTGAPETRMLLVTPRLRVVHVTTHIPLRAVSERVTRERVLTTIALLVEALRRMGIPHPRVAVAGLNPHAGEGGRFGDEEVREIGPAVAEARRRGWQVVGPLPGDTVFYRALQGEFDAVVAIYHDQGHIPVKLLGFEEGVNVTLGLPIVRTSVDHGTAFDIAWQGKASPRSMVAAIGLAAALARGEAR